MEPKVVPKLTAAQYEEQLERAATFIKERISNTPQIAIVLGSGLAGFADFAFDEKPVEIPYSQIPGLPGVTVVGHKGILYSGCISGRPVICFGGRFHSYEGHAPHVCTMLPRLARKLGCTTYVLTNAAGGTAPGMRQGCLMTIENHDGICRWDYLYGYDKANCNRAALAEELRGCKTLDDVVRCVVRLNSAPGPNSGVAAASGANANAGAAHPAGQYPYTFSSSDVYSKRLNALADEIAHEPSFQKYRKVNIDGEDRIVEVHHGSYLFYGGPTYETKVEVKAIQKVIPGSVGMSSIPEAGCAHTLGMEVYALSLITDLASGPEDGKPLTHEIVARIADRASSVVRELVKELLTRAPKESAGLRTPIALEEALTCTTSNIIPDHENENSMSSELEDCKSEFVLPPEVRKVLFVTTPFFYSRVCGDSAIFGLPVTASRADVLYLLQQVSVIGACCAILVSDLAVPKLPLDAFVNYTSHHFPVVPRAVGANAFGSAGSPQAEGNYTGERLVVTEGCEDPHTSVLLRNAMPLANLHHCTNKVSAVLPIMCRLCGVCETQFVSPEGALAFLSATSPVYQPRSLEFALRPSGLQIFAAAQPDVNEVSAIAEGIRKAVGSEFDRAILLDGTFEPCARLQRITDEEAGMHLPFPCYAHGSTLVIECPSLASGCSLACLGVPARVCQLLGIESVIPVTNEYVLYTEDGSCDQERHFMADYSNLAGCNTLRGENREEWGPRFPDISHSLDEAVLKSCSAKAELTPVVAVLSLSPLSLTPSVPRIAHVAAGRFQCVSDLLHGGRRIAGILARDWEWLL